MGFGEWARSIPSPNVHGTGVGPFGPSRGLTVYNKKPNPPTILWIIMFSSNILIFVVPLTIFLILDVLFSLGLGSKNVFVLGSICVFHMG